jgi:hypothetical protein
MDGFKTLPKMQHFKEGGKVNVMREGGKAKPMCSGGSYKEGGKADIKQDEKTAKKVVKSAFGMHDNQLHDGEKTDLSKLRKGGRTKKEGGNVRKYKAGGSIESGKESGDADKIKKVKDNAPKKATAPSEAAKRPSSRSSDVEKEKSKSAADKDKIKKVPPTGDKKADAESKAQAKPAKGGLDAVDDIDGMKRGSAVKKHKAGGPIKKMAVGSLTGSLMGQQPAPGALTPQQRLAIQQAMFRPQQAAAAPQQANPVQPSMLPQGAQ